MTAKKTAASAQDAASEAMETMAGVGKETIETAMKVGVEAANEGYKNATAYSREQMEMAKTAYDRSLGYNKENLDAMSEASAVAMAGAEACLTEIADYTRTAMAENLDVMQRLFAVKTPQEFFEIQLEATNKTVNRAVAQTTKLNQIATDSLTKACAPIRARMDETMETFVKPYTG